MQVVGRSEKKGRVAFQERRVLRLEVVFWKTRMRMTSRHTTTTTRAVKGKGRMKKDEGWGRCEGMPGGLSDPLSLG
jgi:hypothetical protein